MAVNLNGSTDFLAIASGLGITAYPFTVLFWFRVANLTADMRGVELRASGDGDTFAINFLGATAGDPLTARSTNQGVNTAEASTGASGIATGAWYQGGARWIDSGNRQVILNGSASGGTIIGVSASFPNNTYFGANNNGAGLFWNGDLAGLAVWDANLTDGEIVGHSRGIAARRIRPQSLRAYVPGVRSIQQLMSAGAAVTATGTTPADHHRSFGF